MIWQACNGASHIKPLTGLAYRLVESQEQVATLSYVDTLEEQVLLEDILEGFKPPYPENSDSYHYLLKTPFRYPPLQWGSRFGRVHEPSIFYGGTSLEVTLTESAYYRFVFWHSMAIAPPKNRICTEHTLFSVNYKSQFGVQLHQVPFIDYQHELTHPAKYHTTQQLGCDMRAAEVEVFEYNSARESSELNSICIGIYQVTTLVQKLPKNMSQWFCEINQSEVSFKQKQKAAIKTYSLDEFLYKGKFPFPA